MSSIFVQQALIESGLPEADTKITDEVFGRLTFVPNCWTKQVELNYFGIKDRVSIYIHTYDGSINDTQRDCYEEFMDDIEGTLENHKDAFRAGCRIDCLIFQVDSLVVILCGKSEDDYMALEFEP